MNGVKFISLVAAVIALSTCSVGCSSFGQKSPCIDIGWPHIITVELEGNAKAVKDVQLCSEGQCFPLAITEISNDGEGVLLNGQNADSWSFYVGTQPLDSAEVVALDSKEEILGEHTVSLAWTRTGGTDECGGPGKAVISVRV